MKTIAAFLNTEGGDLVIGVADDGTPLGLDADGFANDDLFLRHLMDVTCTALGNVAATAIDPRIQTVDGKAVCLVACQRSPEPVFLKWKGTEKAAEGDFYVRTGPGSRRLEGDEVARYVAARFAIGHRSG